MLTARIAPAMLAPAIRITPCATCSTSNPSSLLSGTSDERAPSTSSSRPLARVGPGAARPDAEQPVLDEGDRAAAGADRAHVDPRGLQRHPDHFALVLERRPPVDQEAGVEAGA